MLFNSFQFIEFFLIVYCAYLFLNHKWQNRMLLVASCVFYGAWDWRFLFLMFSSISVDYFCAANIHKSENQKTRKRFLLLSICVNLTVLGFFKYFNFFGGSLQALFDWLGLSVHTRALNIILPIGISFYTFEAMSYVIDVYRKKMEPAKTYLDYALFVIYFPHLIAGPIMRAKDLLPQISFPRTLSADKFYEGAYLIFWGMFQKVFIADNLARIADPVFASSPPYNGIKVMLALYAFAFQIYCDFAGYSNIARGLGKLMGFDIMINFNLPYFAANPREFWQRWHISLSTWLRDYLYIPLGGNKKGTSNTYKNLFITMLLGGLWHGAAWTFVLWGAYHGALLAAHRMFQPLFKKFTFLMQGFSGKVFFAIKVIVFFNLIAVSWLLFRSRSMTQAYQMARGVLFNFHINDIIGLKDAASSIIFFICILAGVELLQYRTGEPLVVFRLPTAARAVFYFICFYLIVIWGVHGGKQFIYFQF